MGYDRQIRIEQPIRARGSNGEPITTWQLFVEVWAEQTPVRARERFSSDQIRGVRAAVFTIRYMNGIKPDMRIVANCNTYAITGISEIGRQSQIEMIGESIQGSGEVS